ncbi:MAG: NUDIX domain-containing protein [Hyphomicrobiaceae bacterium]
MAASAILLRDGSVLLVLRGQGANAGLWSAPGGRLEPGETPAEAARRETLEETGLAANIAGTLGILRVRADCATGDSGSGFDIHVHFGRAGPGQPVAASDAAQAALVPLADVRSLATTEGLIDLIETAATRLSGNSEGTTALDAANPPRIDVTGSQR